MYPFRRKKVENNRKNKNKQKQSASFEIKEQTDCKQKGIPQQTAIVEKAKSRQHKGKERPKIELGK